MAFSKINLDVPALQKVTDALKSWIMLFLTIAFVILYALALSGRLKPLPDTSLVARLEPIIFVIIGYYFGRIPGQQNENTLKNEISRQTQRADAAQHARDQQRQKRGAKAKQVSLSEAAAISIDKGADLIALDEALTRLAADHARKSRVVELRYFGGLSVEEIAEVLQISEVTVARDWKFARAWLLREMKHG